MRKPHMFVFSNPVVHAERSVSYFQISNEQKFRLNKRTTLKYMAYEGRVVNLKMCYDPPEKSQDVKTA